ncbi:WD40 repeat-like protein [Trametes versicolor FP-101664 SS1]|uniref:WD40 repeat-like protein n=1 Tax=Trametes versicolor (strain FP-101664) TaxID=717944 RepID=UPI0004623D19|nr:WD40 repeat-like protein [Trametes versicolor FP-101664 SS1]EIW52294.1 WD40 repeat-like protein [Trametes versicolor FP-101664 SS1]
MIQTGLISNAHSDLVTDASYDFYGLRLATCSLDQRVKVWQLDETTGSWSLEHDWKAHDAAISKVSWAHPEFGTILATASFDRTVKVWEQVSAAAPDADGGASSSASASRWAERAMLVDAKGTVRAVEFAPSHFGLKLATISSDNCLRIYECLEQPSLAAWQLIEEVDVLSLPISASPAARSVAQTLSLATPTQTASAPLDSASVSLVAHALQQQAAQNQNQLPGRPGLGTREADGGWSISWCKDKYWGEIIAAGCGIDGIVKIIQVTPSRRPSSLLSLNPAPASSAPSASDPSIKSPAAATHGSSGAGSGDGWTGAKTCAVTSIAWAPSCGRSYHLVATGARDGHVRIWRVKPPTPSEDLDAGAEEGDGAQWTASIVGDFDDHKSAVGRVEWNITGTVLSSAGNDGRVRLWKMTAGNVWRPAGHISVEQAEEQQGDVDMGDVAVDD